MPRARTIIRLSASSEHPPPKPLFGFTFAANDEMQAVTCFGRRSRLSSAVSYKKPRQSPRLLVVYCAARCALKEDDGLV